MTLGPRYPDIYIPTQAMFSSAVCSYGPWAREPDRDLAIKFTPNGTGKFSESRRFITKYGNLAVLSPSSTHIHLSHGQIPSGHHVPRVTQRDGSKRRPQAQPPQPRRMQSSRVILSTSSEVFQRRWSPWADHLNRLARHLLAYGEKHLSGGFRGS